MDFIPKLTLPCIGLASDRSEVHLDGSAGLTKLIVHFASYEGTLLFSYELQPGSKRAQLLKRFPQFFFNSFAFGNFFSKLEIHFHENRGTLRVAQLELVLGLFETNLFFVTFRQVSRDFNETKHVPAGVSQRSNDHTGPELGTVLADSPAFVFAFPPLHGLRQVMFGSSVPCVLWTVKQGVIFSENFAFAITFHTLGTCIPANNSAPRVQLKNGVLTHTFNE